MTSNTQPRYPDLDRDLEQRPGLAIAERVSQRRWSPRRNHWNEVSAFDERASELEQRHAQITAELQELHARHANAPTDDAARLAQWELQNRKGPRPEPQADNIDREIQARRADLDGITLAVDQTLQDKVAYVTKHRHKLQQKADREVNTAHARLAAALGEVAVARADLIECRADAVWAGVFPQGNGGVSPQTNFLAGGLRRVAQILGIDVQIHTSRILEALHADADWLKTAATPEQRVVLERRNPRTPPDTAWFDSDEARAERKRDNETARDRHTKEWGRPPSW